MNARRAHPRSRAGLTFLEVVVSLAILGGVASMVFGVIGFIERASVHDMHRLNAMEVAHRTVIAWIDDPEWISRQPKRTILDGHTYVFDVSEQVLVGQDEDGEGGVELGTAVDEDAVGIEEFAQSAMRVLDITVWHEDEDGVVDDEPLVHMTRTYWLYATQRGQGIIIQKMMEEMASRGGGSGAQGN